MSPMWQNNLLSQSEQVSFGTKEMVLLCNMMAIKNDLKTGGVDFS